MLNGAPLAGLMLVVTLGYLVGRPAWRGLSLGPGGGTLFVALLFGWLGLELDSMSAGDEPTLTVGRFGFALFIYSIGFEAGGGFFGALRTSRGWRIIGVAVVVNTLAVLLAIAVSRLLNLRVGETAGLLAGSLTSAPTYAAANEANPGDPGLSIAFALTFPFGLVGMVLLVQVASRFFRQDLAGDAERVESERRPRRRGPRGEPDQKRAFHVVRQNVLSKTLRELDLSNVTGAIITRVYRDETVLIPEATTTLESGDHILATGRVEELRELEKWVGPEIYDKDLEERLPPPRRIIVHHAQVIGKALAELELTKRYRSLVVAVERNGERLEPSGKLVLFRGDIVEVVGARGSVRSVAAEFGRVEPSDLETDIAVYAGGILIGLAIGAVPLSLIGLPGKIGLATGLLVAGLLLGSVRKIGPFSAHVPPSARQLVRDLGILLFVAETGLPAGRRLTEALTLDSLALIAAGVFVTLVPIVGALLVARFILRLRLVDTWGSVAGGMTSSAALLAVKRAADSDEPAVSYATAYAVASVLATIAGHIIVALCR